MATKKGKTTIFPPPLFVVAGPRIRDPRSGIRDKHTGSATQIKFVDFSKIKERELTKIYLHRRLYGNLNNGST